MPPSVQTRVIRVVVNAPGVKAALENISSSMGNLNKNTKQLASSLSTLGNVTTGIITAAGIRKLATFSDEIQNIDNRLRALTGSQEAAAQTMSRLVQISRETNQSVSSISESYLRLSVALQDVGISQSTLLDTTKTIANTFRLSGATTDEAKNATIQLGQAFSLGALRGQDLRSVMSQNVVLTKLLRKEFGNDLLKAAEQGLITVPKLLQILHDNMDAVNKQAEKMGATFEQSVTKGLDAFKLKVFEINTSIGASSKFAKAIQFLVDHSGTISAALLGLAVTTIPLLVIALGSMAVAFLAAAAPITIIAGGLAALLATSLLLAPAFTATLDPVEQLTRAILDLGARTLETISTILSNLPGIIGATFKIMAIATISSAAEMRKAIETIDFEAITRKRKKMQDDFKNAGGDKFSEDIAKARAELLKELDPKQQLVQLNKRFNEGAISVAEYNREILQLDLKRANFEFKEGEKNLNQLNESIKKVQIFELNQQLATSVITLDEFNAQLSEIKTQDLQRDLLAGTISVEEFNKKIAAVSDKFSLSGSFTTGLQDYISAIGTSTQQVAGLITNAFKGLEDQLFNFIKKGKFDFANFTQAILDDLTRIVIRASIVQPLAGGLLGLINSGTAGTLSSSNSFQPGQLTAANGAAFDGGLTKFASGGIVDSPTMFKYGGGKGIMGEAGPEAILPLSRGSGGNLGVTASVTPVTINIINNTPAEVESREVTGPSGEKVIEMLISNRVKEGITNGSFDKSFQQSYGLNRRGS